MRTHHSYILMEGRGHLLTLQPWSNKDDSSGNRTPWSACLELLIKVSSTDNAITKGIEEYASSLTTKQSAYIAITQQLKEAINWSPAIPEPNLVICNTQWLNNWDALIKGERPSNCETSTEPPRNGAEPQVFIALRALA
uniref:Uncharacterized protein n=1 Tax=Cacopsylla melanoneura TaxID=428564 RepID=A0A8D9BXW5_9HEMI